jgi:GDPmannose 4,6-dehydratase
VSKPIERSVVTGASGQDGGYLIERVLAAGDEVHGFCHSEQSASLLRSTYPRATVHVVDLTDSAMVHSAIGEIEPTRVFNLAGITSVAQSWNQPLDTADILALGPLRLMTAIRDVGAATGRPIRLLQASSAEVFGESDEVPQSEQTRRAPVSPYGIAKDFADRMISVARIQGVHASSAILFNHESPRRAEAFVSQKIARAAARIAAGDAAPLALGNIDVERDWGYAPDYVDAMIRIVEQPVPGDYVVATGRSHSVREFVAQAFAVVGIRDWSEHITIDETLARPNDPTRLVGDATRLQALGWAPTLDFAGLVELMVRSAADQLGSQQGPAA